MSATICRVTLGMGLLLSHLVKVDNISCNSFDINRSGYQQLKQLELVDEKQTEEEIMENVLKHCDPHEPGTNKRQGDCFVPPLNSFEWFINRNALNGWLFQNHFDCVASAIAGSINTCLGNTRKNRGLSPSDIRAFLIMSEYKMFFKSFHRLVLASPDHDFTPLVNYLIQNPAGSAFDSNESTWKDKIEDMGTIERLNDFSEAEDLFVHFERVKKLKKAQIETSTHDLTSFINDLPFGIEARSIHEYTWFDFKSLLQQENSALLVRLPAHLAMIFGAGEDQETGKKRHVLIGRPSGGQSPSGWIPWLSKDIVPGETTWNDGITLSGGLESTSNCGLTMFLNAAPDSALQKFYICQREIIHLVKSRDVNLDLSNYNIETQTKWDHVLFQVPIETCTQCVDSDFVFLKDLIA